MAGTPLLVAKEIGKSYDGAVALSEVSLDIRAGEVLGLVGENGAGKSTLIKVLTGSVVPDVGQVEFQGRPLTFGDPLRSQAMGISVIHQEPTLFPDLPIEDNLFIGREPLIAGSFLDLAQVRRESVRLMSEVGQSLPLGVPVGQFSIAHRQMVAVARALAVECRLLIMDEPTASLSVREAATLHATVRRLRGQGVSVLFVSHRLEEVLDLCDRVTVLRDGRTVETRAASAFDHEGLIRSMVGRDVTASKPSSSTPGPIALEVHRLTRAGSFKDVSLKVHQGEVLGIGGLVGAGRTEVVRSIAGIDRADSGIVTVSGRPLPRGGMAAALEAGIALVPEDRRNEGLVLPLSVRSNLVMSVRRRLARFGFIHRKAEATVAAAQSRAMAVKASSDDLPVAALSGGNQQKVVLGKWLATEPKVLILDEPTKGVDVGAKSEIHRIVRELASCGRAVIVVSSDLPELLALSDRILVMSGGRIAGELSGAEADEESVTALAFSRSVP